MTGMRGLGAVVIDVDRALSAHGLQVAAIDLIRALTELDNPEGAQLMTITPNIDTTTGPKIVCPAWCDGNHAEGWTQVGDGDRYCSHEQTRPSWDIDTAAGGRVEVYVAAYDYDGKLGLPFLTVGDTGPLTAAEALRLAEILGQAVALVEQITVEV